MAPKRLHHAYLIVVACSCMSLCVGITYNAAGIFFPPVLKELGMSRGALAIYMSLVGVMSALFLPLAGRLMKGKNVRALLSTAVLIHAATTAGMSLSTNVYHFYIAGAILGMTLSFFLYVATPTLIGRWFAHSGGVYVGVCFAFTVGGAIVFNPIAGYVIENFGWRMGYVSLGLCSLILVFIPVVLFVRGNPEDIGLKPWRNEKIVADTTDVRLTGASVSEIFKNLTIIAVLLYVSSVALFSDLFVYLPSYVTSEGMGMAMVATMMSTAMVGAVVGKIGLGALNDKSVIGAMSLCGLSGFLGTLGMLYIGPVYPIGYYVAAFLYGVAYSAPTVQSALLISKIYGTREFPQIYSMIMMIYAIATASGQSLWGYIADSQGGNFTLSFQLVASLCVVFTVAASTAYKMRNRVVWTIA